MGDLKGQAVIVTGASSGIGEATAREFGRQGARVALAARRVERLEAVARDIEAAGGEALVVAADLSKLEDIQALIDQTAAQFGRIDVLVNNAGFGRLNFLDRLDPVKDIEPQYRVNVLGYVEAEPVRVGSGANSRWYRTVQGDYLWAGDAKGEA